MRLQTSNRILMVRPSNFGFNAETAKNNAFQSKSAADKLKAPNEKARTEFDRFVLKLSKAGIIVEIWEDRAHVVKPDAIFPNNWISFHQDQSIGLYPMYAVSRRKERDPQMIKWLREKYVTGKVIDFTAMEKENIFLEGTGSLVLDRANKVAYACLSPRTDAILMERFCKQFGYKKMLFSAVDQNGQDIYHTNVMMAMGDDFVVICKDSIADNKEWSALENQFKANNKEIINISFEQMNHYAGNMLLLRNEEGSNILVMSTRAYKSLQKNQIKQIEKYAVILHSSINTIENLGGGSVRCMMAELFLEPKYY